MLIKKCISLFLGAVFLFTLFTGCSRKEVTEQVVPSDTQEENKVIGEVSDTLAYLPGEISIEDLGTFTFDPNEIKTIREDIFMEGYFSIFDVLVYLEKKGQIEIDYTFDETMNTYVIDSLDGRTGWWYDAYYDGGWRERSVFRMDHYPYKDKMTLNIVQHSDEYLESIFMTYRDEIRRKNENNNKVIVPEVIIEGKNGILRFDNVEVKSHNLRPDMFQPGVVTAIDTLLTLAEEGKISCDLQWYESIGTAGVVKSYWVNRINDDESQGRCGFVYEAGDENFLFFRGNHVHIPSDIRVINSPQYVKYFWICI